MPQTLTQDAKGYMNAAILFGEFNPQFGIEMARKAFEAQTLANLLPSNRPQIS